MDIRRLLLCVTAIVITLFSASADEIEYTYAGSTLKYTTNYDGTCAVSGYVSTKQDLTIPSQVEVNNNTYRVTGISTRALKNCSMTTMKIPNSVTSIGESAFLFCSGLTSVDIPNSVRSIGDAAFSGCTSLSSVVIPNSMTSIGFSVFYDCSSLTSVSIPNSVTLIGPSAFELCSSLKSVNIPGSVTSIGNEAFFDCSSLTSVNIPNSVTSIGRQAFKNCSSLSSVNIPASVTSIGVRAFYACSSMSSVTIPNSVTSIGEEMFSECSALTSVTIPNSVTSIGAGAFTNCIALKSVTISNSVTSIGEGVFDMCTSLTSVVIPNSVVSVGKYAFGNCRSLTSVFIPNSVTSIGECAFIRCSALLSVVIPSSVTTIERHAFSYCSDLKKVVLGCNIKYIGDYAFQGYDFNADMVFCTAQQVPVALYDTFADVYTVVTGKLYVQGESSIDAYRNADYYCWKRFDIYAMSEPDSLTMEKPTTVVGKAGESFTLKATVSPADVDLPYVFWRSTDPKKAYVDNFGVVTVLQDISADDEVEIIAETLYANGPTAKFSFATDVSGIDEVMVDSDDASALIDVYNLQGVAVLRAASPDAVKGLLPGTYLLRQGRKTTKIMVK